MQKYHVILHVIVHADDKAHAHEQASLMFDDNVVVVDSDEKCDDILGYYQSSASHEGEGNE